ncbi:hypothetical protein B6S12_04965 [Helicobacter valdiviensis]|uniref:Lipoprotein n=1 Tax=Helicobacter valdiviensis TaxID=1458358 RepID=A0A2W6MWI7_9HELI|nr:hypothetical protein [Helicobacter valdiviensis]PZT48281.1 hypothetical protein B6S12_04965 [Helicobacter valdiviensis]
MRLAFLLVCSAIFFSGCVYHNRCGLSASDWEDKGYYYDSQGNYKETCPDDMLLYKDNAPRNTNGISEDESEVY